MIKHQIDLQHAANIPIEVSDNCIKEWAQKTLTSLKGQKLELTIRFVDKNEIAELNRIYRKQDKATNVLAFPSDIPEAIPLKYPFLGDVIICPAVLHEEAFDKNILYEAHFAHILIHGILHLLGYTHEEESDTQKMQSLEIKMLESIGFSNPYYEDK